MKRTICALGAIALLIWTPPPARAEWRGELWKGVGVILNVDNSASPGPTAVSAHYWSTRREENEITRDEIEIRTAPAGARIQFVFSKPGASVRRIIVDVDAVENTTIDVEINQSAGPSQNQSFPVRIEGRRTIVFDVVDLIAP